MQLKQILESILFERQSYDWKAADPFQLSDESLGGVIPIIRKTEDRVLLREYKLYEEAEKENAVRITDSGKIERLKVISNSKEPIFVRMGSVFTGDTQARAASLSVFIMPETEKEVPVEKRKGVEIPVKCVHASHGIATGAGMVQANVTAPRNVMHSFMSGGNQQSVWSSVQNYSSRALYRSDTGTMTTSGSLMPGSDNLLGVKQQLRKAKETVGDYIKKIPRLTNQVGAIIFDSRGIVGMEVFDHPDSWSAFQDSVYEEYEDVLLAKQEEVVYKVDKKALIKQAEKFLKEATKLEGKLEFNEGGAKTFLLKGEKKIGEFSTLSSKIIHFIIMREQEQKRETPAPQFQSYPPAYRSSYPQGANTYPARGYRTFDYFDEPPRQPPNWIYR